MNTKELVTCGQCALAVFYSLPDQILLSRIIDYRREYNRPMANRLQAVLNGEDFLIERHCRFHDHAFGSSLCGSPSEFQAS